MTYYAPGLGACGITSSENEDVCAISHVLYDAHNRGGNPNNNPLCGHKIRATRRGKSLVLTVVDRCMYTSFVRCPFDGRQGVKQKVLTTGGLR